MKQILLATHNTGKLREFSALLAQADVTLIAQDQLGIAPIDEPYATFVENALAKARHAAKQSGLPTLADDSGLCVHALNGAPGVRSARFAQNQQGDECSDAANNTLLLERMAVHTDRRAHYTCTLVLVRHADDPEPLVTTGRWHGEIATTPRGEKGFGYDPVFYLPDVRLTVAELCPAVKSGRSHRAQALTQLLAQLANEYW